jgi:hypothetical protein
MKQIMKQLDLNWMRLLAGVCGLFTVVALAPATIAQQASPVQGKNPVAAAKGVATSATKPAAEEEESAAPNSAGVQGIKIHGHWVLELKNPDGKVVERREFNNSLVTGGGMMTGDQILAALISGNASPGGLAVAFISGPTTTSGLDFSSFCDVGDSIQVPVPTGIKCFGFYPTNSGVGNVALNQQAIGEGEAGLTNAVSFSPTVSIVLSGNYTVPAAMAAVGTVNAVETYAGLCVATTSTFAGTGTRLTGTSLPFQAGGNLAPSACVANVVQEYSLAGVLTSTNIPGGPLAVVANQIITVTVTLSFS